MKGGVAITKRRSAKSVRNATSTRPPHLRRRRREASDRVHAGDRNGGDGRCEPRLASRAYRTDKSPTTITVGTGAPGVRIDSRGRILRDTDLDEHLAVARMNQHGVTTRDAYDGGAQERALADQYSAAADRVRGRWPRSGALLDGLSRSYRDDARREDRSAEGQGDR